MAEPNQLSTGTVVALTVVGLVVWGYAMYVGYRLNKAARHGIEKFNESFRDFVKATERIAEALEKQPGGRR